MAIELGSAYGKVELDASGVQRGVRQSQSALDCLQQTVKNVFQYVMGNLAAAGVQALTRSLAGLGREIKGTATDFESQMAIMKTAVDPTVASLDDLRAAAIVVGQDTSLVGIDAEQAADAMTGLFKAGLSVNDVFGDMQGYIGGTVPLTGALRASVDLQAASALGLAQASGAVSVAMATYGLSAEDATRISNSFVQSADASVAEVEDLVAALTNVGPTAAALGISLEDTNNALALLSTRGISGAEAGTALKSMLANLQRPTDKVVETLNALNVSLYDAEGQFVGLPSLVQQFERGLSGLTDEQRNLAMQTVAGTYGMNALNTLLAEGVDGWDAMAQATADAASASEVAAARTDTLKGAQEALQGTLDTLKIQIGSALIPMWRRITKVFSDLVEKYGPDITRFFETVGGAIATFIEALDGGATPLDAFKKALATLGEPGVQIANTIEQVEEAISYLLAVIRENDVARFFSTFEDGSSYIENFLQMLGVGSEQAQSIGETINSVVQAFLSLKTAISTTVGMIQAGTSPLEALRAVLLQFGGETGARIVEVFDAIKAKFDEFIQQALPYVLTGWAVLQGVVLAFVQTVWPAIQSAFGSIKGIISEVAAQLQYLGVGWDDLGRVVGVVAAIIGAALVGAIGIIAGVVNAISGLLQALKDAFATFGADVRAILDAFKSWISAVGDFFKAIFAGDIQGALTALKTAWSSWWDMVGGVLTLFKDGVAAVLDMILSTVSGFVDGFVNFLLSLKGNIESFSLADAGKNLIQGFINGITSMAGAVKNALGDMGQRAIDAVKEKLGISSPSKVFGWIAEMTGEGFIDQLRSMQGAMTKATEAVMGNVVAAAMPTMLPATATASGGMYDQRQYNNVTMPVTAVQDALDIERLAQRVVALLRRRQ